MGKRYQRRAADMIQAQLSDLLQTQVNDPRVEMVTITVVDVTPDITQAHVYFSVLGGSEAQTEALAGLQSAAGFLRWELGQRVRLRNTPKLIFHFDYSLERGERISSLLDQLHEEDETKGPGSEP